MKKVGSKNKNQQESRNMPKKTSDIDINKTGLKTLLIMFKEILCKIKFICKDIQDCRK